MADPPGGRGSDATSCCKEQAKQPNDEGRASAAVTTPACGAHKFLMWKCASGCIFAPYFGTNQSAARFVAMHKVLGASNVSKLLQHIAVNTRQDTVVTVSYEVQARLSGSILWLRVYHYHSRLAATGGCSTSRGCNGARPANEQQICGHKFCTNFKTAVASAATAADELHVISSVAVSLFKQFFHLKYISNNHAVMNHMSSFSSNFDAATPPFEPL